VSNVDPHIHFSAQRWKTATHQPRTWEFAFVFAALLSLGVLMTQIDSSALSDLLNPLLPKSFAQIHEQALQGPTQQLTVPELIEALQDPDPQVRLSAVQTLGWRRAAEATDAVLQATYDPDVHVREEAATALGNLGQFQTLPRLLTLQVAEPNANVQLAAFEAEDQLTAHLAAGLKVPRSAVQAWGVAPNGTVDVAVFGDLYRLDHGAWKRIDRLPASPSGLALGPNGQLIYLTTANGDLYRSQDGGLTWEEAALSGSTANPLKVTAAVIDPRDAQTIYLALAEETSSSSLGVIATHDGGKTWWMLNAPLNAETRQLILDPKTPGYLYGLTSQGSYRIALADSSSVTKFN
jgi:HEAT repeats